MEGYTASQAAIVTGLPLPAVRKAIEKRLVRPRKAGKGRSRGRLLSKQELVFLCLEAHGLNLLPLATRRRVAGEVDTGIDAITMTDAGLIVIQVKAARERVETQLSRLQQAEQMVVSDPEVMGGAPVFLGTRIPVRLVADMLKQGATVEEILDGYPALSRLHLELAPIYAGAFPQRGRPPARLSASQKPRRVSLHQSQPNLNR